MKSSAAAAAASGRTGVIRLRPTAAFAAVASQQAVNDGSRAADAGLNADRALWTILTASAALHTSVAIHNLRAFSIHFKYIVGTDIQAKSAADTFRRVHRQCCDIFQINQASHYCSHVMINDVIHTARPRIPAVISRGKANRISFFTPESDV